MSKDDKNKREKIVQESVRLPKWAIEELDIIANYLNFPRSYLIRQYIYEGIKRNQEGIPASLFEKIKNKEEKQ